MQIPLGRASHGAGGGGDSYLTANTPPTLRQSLLTHGVGKVTERYLQITACYAFPPQKNPVTSSGSNAVISTAAAPSVCTSHKSAATDKWSHRHRCTRPDMVPTFHKLLYTVAAADTITLGTHLLKCYPSLYWLETRRERRARVHVRYENTCSR